MRWLRVADNRRRVHAWLHEQAERPLLRPLARVVRPLVWRGLVPAGRWLAGPARFALGRLTPGELGLELTTLVAIAAVGVYAFFALDHVVGVGPTPVDSDAFDVTRQLDAAPFAAGIGLGRVELRVHYLTDVFAGWSLGAAVFALCGVAGLVVARVRHTNLARS